jgi:hypothetical protein
MHCESFYKCTPAADEVYPGAGQACSGDVRSMPALWLSAITTYLAQALSLHAADSNVTRAHSKSTPGAATAMEAD